MLLKYLDSLFWGTTEMCIKMSHRVSLISVEAPPVCYVDDQGARAFLTIFTN